MKRSYKILSILLVFGMLLALFAGCGTTSQEPSQAKEKENGAAEKEGSKETTEPTNDDEEIIELTIYQANNTAGQLSSMGEQACFIEYAKRTNVDLKWEHPADGSDGNEQLNLMIASNQLPDMIRWNWVTMPGGIAKYINDGVAVPLNDLLEDYAPHYKAIIDGNEKYQKVIPLDDGTIPSFYQLDNDPRRTTYFGLIIRQDWLDTLNLPFPETLEDWHNTLTAFKENDPNGNGQADEIPWTEAREEMLQGFMPAFGILREMYINQETDTIDYGPYNKEAFDSFVKTMHQWYNEGLIDPEFATNDNKLLTSKIVGNTAGSTIGYVGSGVGAYVKAAREEYPDFSIVGTNPPKASNGITYMPQNDSKMVAGQSCIITSSSKHPERVASFLDYAYSEEGRTLLNYGIEGESYEVIDGKKVFVDSIMNPPAGKNRIQQAVHFAQPNIGWNKEMDYEAQSQVQFEIEEQGQTVENWLKADNSLQVHPNISLTPEESSEYAEIFNDVKTYVDEMTLKFIIGTEDLSGLDTFHDNLKNMQVDRMIEIYQDAYERFLNR